MHCIHAHVFVLLAMLQFSVTFYMLLCKTISFFVTINICLSTKVSQPHLVEKKKKVTSLN